MSRPRLDELFARMLDDNEAVAVFAAAGSGKTTQTQLFADGYGKPVVWLTLDAGDRSGSRLLVYLATAVARTANESALAHVEGALDAGLSLRETAATLAETIGDAPMLIVFDDCEAIVGATEAVLVLETFLHYLPGSVRTLLLSREELDEPIGRMMLQGRVGRITDADLALSEGEARDILEQQGQPDRDPLPLLDASGGWVAAFAFDVRADLKSVTGRDALTSYLHHQVLGRLPEAEQGFLLRTSLLSSVSPSAAVALCDDDGYALWQSLASRHLPASLTVDRTLVYHPRFREFLRDELYARHPAEVPDLQRRHARLLEDSGHTEEAVEILLAIDELDAAVEVAERALPSLYARADWNVVLGWLDRLGEDRIVASPMLEGARIRALNGTRQISEAQARIRHLHANGRLLAITEADPGLVAHLGWALQWQPAEALRLIDRYGGDYRAEAVRYELMAVSGDDPVMPPGGQAWSEMERIVSWGLLIQGRLDELMRMLPTEEWPPRSFYRTPHPLLGLLWRGEVSRARAMFDEVSVETRDGAHTDLWYFHESWLLWAEEDLEGALVAAEAAVMHSRKTRFGWEPCFRVAVGAMLLGLGHVEDARTVFADSISQSSTVGVRAYAEWGQTFQGLALLHSDLPEDAARVLRRATDAMTKADRRLMLPVAATYLAEAEHRCGRAAAASQYADVAYTAASTMGATFVLQRALADVPDVLARKIAEDGADDRWRRLVAMRAPVPSPREAPTTILTPRPGGSTPGTRMLEVQTFGDTVDLHVDGVPSQIRRLKLVELAAYLALHPEGVNRRKLQERLFPDADAKRGGNYFRQVVHKMRQATGTELARGPDGLISWPADLQVDSTDRRLERLLAEAGHQAGQARFERLETAVSLAVGPYLPQSDLDWAESRRFEIEVRCAEARVELARLAFELGRHEDARRWAEEAIAGDEFAEPAYRVLMHVESAIGAPGALLTVYQRLCAALAEINVEPAGATVELFNELRAS